MGNLVVVFLIHMDYRRLSLGTASPVVQENHIVSGAWTVADGHAWAGEREWYMGAVTICLMVGGFLMAADYRGQCTRILYLGGAASVIVALIGLLQKLGYDPLGLLKGYVVGDWEYTHMLSTLGNNNWLSGYYSVIFTLKSPSKSTSSGFGSPYSSPAYTGRYYFLLYH